jgi:hypothetical protein
MLLVSGADGAAGDENAHPAAAAAGRSTPGLTNDTPRTSDMLPTPGVGVTDSVLQTPGGRAGGNMRSRASSYIPSAVSRGSQP